MERYANKQNLVQLAKAVHDKYSPVATPTANGLMSAEDKVKVDGLGKTDDPTDAGPIVALSAKGWAEQDTTVGKNLWPEGSDSTSSGITWTVNADGSVTANGTATAEATKTALITLAAGTYTISAGIDPSQNANYRGYAQTVIDGVYETVAHTSGYPSATFTLSESTAIRLVLRISNGYTANNLTFYPQLELGSTATSYEPYSGGAPSPSPSFPQEIRRVTGRNLLDAATFFADLDSRQHTKNLQLAPNTTYVMSTTLPKNNNDAANLFVFETGASASTNTNGVWDGQSRTVTTGADGIVVIMYRTNGYIDTSAAWYLSHDTQLELGSVATSYVPYGCVGVDVQGRNLLGLPSASSSGSGYPLGNSRFPLSLPAGTYTFSFNSASASGRWECAFYDANNAKVIGASARAVVSGANTVTLTANSDIASFEWYINAAYAIDSVQLELGDTAHGYEPYYHTTIPIPLPSRGWVAALPDGTCDTLALDGAGGYTWELATSEKVYDGSESWSKGNGFTYTAKPSDCAAIGDGSASVNKLMMDRFNVSYSQQEGAVYASGANLLFWCGDSYNPSSAADAKSWATSNPITLLYPLATPTTEQGYVDSMPTVPIHAAISSVDLVDLTVRCCADEGAAEIASAWGRRYESRIAALEDAVATLVTAGA